MDGEAGARHARAGAGSRKAGRATWRVRGWPPDAPGATVALHVAANVANDDDSEIGDRIYTDSLTIAVRPETDGPRTP